jgi:hypothetical protein
MSASDEFHDCPACPLEVRNLGAVLRNLVGAVERGEWTRVHKKLRAAKLALETWQPIIDAHFAARDEMTKWPRNKPKGTPDEFIDRLRSLAAGMVAFDCTAEPVPQGVDVPDDYERGVNDAGVLLRSALVGDETPNPKGTT